MICKFSAAQNVFLHKDTAKLLISTFSLVHQTGDIIGQLVL